MIIISCEAEGRLIATSKMAKTIGSIYISKYFMKKLGQINWFLVAKKFKVGIILQLFDPYALFLLCEALVRYPELGRICNWWRLTQLGRFFLSLGVSWSGFSILLRVMPRHFSLFPNPQLYKCGGVNHVDTVAVGNCAPNSASSVSVCATYGAGIADSFFFNGPNAGHERNSGNSPLHSRSQLHVSLRISNRES